MSWRVEEKQRYNQLIMAQMSKGELYMQISLRWEEDRSGGSEEQPRAAAPVRLGSGMRSEIERMQSACRCCWHSCDTGKAVSQ